MNTMFIVNTEYSIVTKKENVALSGVWNHVPPVTCLGCENHYTVRTTILATQQSKRNAIYVVWNTGY